MSHALVTCHDTRSALLVLYVPRALLVLYVPRALPCLAVPLYLLCLLLPKSTYVIPPTCPRVLHIYDYIDTMSL